MIYEIARLTIDPAQAEPFEQAVASCVELFRAAPGCHGMALQRCIETPATYELRVAWDSVDAHMVHFRQSAAYQDWRGRVGHFFVEPPRVDHLSIIGTYF